jgi:multidrug transporter EmrE-like cation transporter
VNSEHRWAFIALMAAGVLLEVAGDVLFKKWADGGRRMWLAVGFILYSTGAIAWARSLKYEDLSKAVIVFMVANAVVAVAAGIFLFGERLSVWNWIGVALGVAAIVLCEV